MKKREENGKLSSLFIYFQIFNTYISCPIKSFGFKLNKFDLTKSTKYKYKENFQNNKTLFSFRRD